MPERIRRVVYVDSGPLRDGIALRPDAESDVELPAWDQLAAEGSSVDGIDEAGLASFRSRATRHPAGVARSPVRVSDPRRLEVPTSVICTSLPSAVLPDMVRSGAIPSELLDLHDVRYVDVPTGHWPMFSRPDALADAIRAEIEADDPQTASG